LAQIFEQVRQQKGHCGNLRVAVQPTAVEHMVKIGDFRKWLAREGGREGGRNASRSDATSTGARDTWQLGAIAGFCSAALFIRASVKAVWRGGEILYPQSNIMVLGE